MGAMHALCPFSIIAALGPMGELGLTRDGVPGLPWPRLAGDMRFFQAVTTATDPWGMAQSFCLGSTELQWHTEGNALIMGRVTWETLPGKQLSGRDLYVLTRQGAPDMSLCASGGPGGVTACDSLSSALRVAAQDRCPNVFVIGGAGVFREALAHPWCMQLFLTEVHGEQSFQADTYWPTTLDGECGRLGWLFPTTPSGIWPRRPVPFSRHQVSQWSTDPTSGIPYRHSLWRRSIL